MAGAATVDKALDVLFHLHASPTPLGLSEIGRALSLPKSSCHRLLSTLVAREVVERDAAGHYRPGLALLALGLGAQGREPVVAAARPVLEAEVRALGETVFLVGLRRGRLRVLEKVEGPGFLRAAPDVGDVIPADVTAAGRIHRALGDPAEVAELDAALGGPLASAEREEVVRSGYATNRDAWIEGLSVVAVPIWQPEADGSRRLVASLALAAASPRFDTLGEAHVARRLRAAGETIGARLGAASPRRRRGGAARAAEEDR
jgi:IclR family acetate operon transcriptional repressor